MGDPEWMPDQSMVQKWQQEAQPFAAAGRIVAKQEVMKAANELLDELNPEYRVSPALLEEWNRAAVSASAVPLTKAALRVALDAALEKERATIRAEVEAEFQDQKKTETARAATADRKAAPKTSVATGSPPGTPKFKTQLEADAALERHEITSRQWRELASELPYQ